MKRSTPLFLLFLLFLLFFLVLMIHSAFAGEVKTTISETSASISVKKHTNPMPDLMGVVKQFSAELKLSKKQAAELKQWRDERATVDERTVQTIIDIETKIHGAVMKDEPLETIDRLADSIMQNRIKIIRSKALGRENMKRILDDTQYQQVLTLYQTHFISKQLK